MEVLKEVETRGRNPIYDFGISWKDNKTEYIKLYMRMVAKNKNYFGQNVQANPTC